MTAADPVDTWNDDREPGRHFTAGEIRLLSEAPRGAGGLRATVLNLASGDSADDLTSTKGRRIWGPTALVTEFFPDGGIDQHAVPLARLSRAHRSMYVDAASVGDRLALAAARDAKENPPRRKAPGRTPEPRYTASDGESKTMRAWLGDPRRRVPEDVVTRRVTQLGWDILSAIRTPQGQRMAAPVTGEGKAAHRYHGRPSGVHTAFGLSLHVANWAVITDYTAGHLQSFIRNQGLEEALRRRGWTGEKIRARYEKTLGRQPGGQP
jgi:hypothetical protein